MQSKKMKTKRVIMLMAVLIFGLGVAAADEISYSDSIPLAKTNWSDVISIPKFNPTLGVLQSIEFTLTGHVEGTAQFESLDSSSATVTMDLATEIKLQRPDLSTILITLPLVSTSDNVGPFDGSIDFGGTSGKTYSNLSADKTETTTSPPPVSDLALFTGFGNINMPIVATGVSTGSGAGNLLLQFMSAASANATVKYIYEVPEPATLSLLGLGIPVLVRRRRR